jgi:hypothetical protein
MAIDLTPALTPAEFLAAHEARVQGHIRRVRSEDAAANARTVTRGTKRRVIRGDGTIFDSLSAAAKASAVNKPDNISQAIKRHGKCGRWHWQYETADPDADRAAYSSRRTEAYIREHVPAHLQDEALAAAKNISPLANPCNWIPTWLTSKRWGRPFLWGRAISPLAYPAKQRDAGTPEQRLQSERTVAAPAATLPPAAPAVAPPAAPPVDAPPLDLRPIPGLAPYAASADGQIYNTDVSPPRRISTRLQRGTLRVCLRPMGRAHTDQVARLVCLAFHGLPPEGKPLALHRSNDTSDNRPENVRWASPREKHDRIVSLGRSITTRRGSAHPNAVLSETKAREIRAHRTAGKSSRDIAAATGSSLTSVREVLANRRWPDPSWTPLPPPKPKPPLPGPLILTLPDGRSLTPIPGWPPYAVTANGEVYNASDNPQRRMTEFLSKGKVWTGLRRNGKGGAVRVAAVVALAFGSLPPAAAARLEVAKAQMETATMPETTAPSPHPAAPQAPALEVTRATVHVRAPELEAMTTQVNILNDSVPVISAHVRECLAAIVGKCVNTEANQPAAKAAMAAIFAVHKLEEELRRLPPPRTSSTPGAVANAA